MVAGKHVDIKNTVTNLTTTSLGWFNSCLWFTAAHLPVAAMYIISLSLFIFMASIIHVLLKCLCMSTAESLRGGSTLLQSGCCHTLCAVCPRLSGMRRWGSWRRRRGEWHGGDRKMMGLGVWSGCWVCWFSCGSAVTHKETGFPWKNWKNKIKRIIKHCGEKCSITSLWETRSPVCPLYRLLPGDGYLSVTTTSCGKQQTSWRYLKQTHFHILNWLWTGI